MKPKPLDQSAPRILAVEIPTVELRGRTYDDLRELVPPLVETMAASGCFLLEQRTLSPFATELIFELQLRSVFELYSSILSSGVDLSRDSHTCMKSLCTVRDHNPHQARRRRILTVRLELVFLEDSGSTHDLARTAMGLA